MIGSFSMRLKLYMRLQSSALITIHTFHYNIIKLMSQENRKHLTTTARQVRTPRQNKNVLSLHLKQLNVVTDLVE